MNKEVLKRILRFTKPYRRYLWGAVLSAVLSIAMTLLAPVLVGQGIDKMIGKGQVDFAGIFQLLIWLAGAILVGAFFQWLLGVCTSTLTHRTVKDIRTTAFDKLNKVPLSYIDQNPHGDIISRIINDIDIISDGLLQGLTQIFTGVVTILGTLAFMLSINPGIALVVVLVTPLSLLLATMVAKLSYHKFKEQSKIQGQLGGLIEEMVGNQKVVKAFTHENEAQKEFEALNKRLYKCGVKAQFYSAISNPGTRFVNGIVYAAVGVVGAISAIQGHISVGELSCFLTYANQYTKPFNEVTAVLTQIQSAFASAGRVLAVIDQKNEEPDSKKARELHDCEGDVELSDVSFSYKPEVPLIKHVSLKARPGARIAIVGPTGCGKTTLINLLMRFYDVNEGEIRVDGIPIKQITRQSLRRLYGMVLQESWLYSGTVRDNIAYGKPNATLEEVVAAAKAAHAHSFIKRLPNGYDTLISEDGGNLSQGQKQLLCIARVMLTDPPMLILDEATSSIDTRTELRIQKAFLKLMQGRTSFIVAHRLSTIKEADLILVMRDGNIIEQGTHEELLLQNGFYAQLYNSQFAAAE